jgi:hypothetical protein
MGVGHASMPQSLRDAEERLQRRENTSWTKSKTVIRIVIFSFLRIFSKYIGGLLKNGLFSRFYCLFVGVFGVERAHSCAPVRKMSKKRRKTKKNEEK